MKSRLLLGAGAVLVLFFAIRWLLAEPTITVDFQDAPLSKVLSAFEKQGKIKIQTQIDPSTPVTLSIRRSPVIDAIDLLAVRLDGDWRMAWVLGPNTQTVREGRALVGQRNPEGWKSFHMPAFGMDWGGVPDPRKMQWKVEAAPDGTLAAYLDQGSQKLPVEFLAPGDWNPVLGGPPASGSPGQVARQLAKATGGQTADVFVLSRGGPGGGFGGGGDGPRRREDADAGAPGGAAPRATTNTPGNAARPPRERAPRNEAWQMERAQAMIESLPSEERKEALGVLEEMRELREQMQGLPEEKRRELWGEYMQRPEVQARREEAQAARDAKRTPEQREARYRRISERRIEARMEAGDPLKAKP